MSITQDFINQFNQYAYDTANSFGGLTANPDPLEQPTHNDQYDAYRHALLSAELSRISETLSQRSSGSAPEKFKKFRVSSNIPTFFGL